MKDRTWTKQCDPNQLYLAIITAIPTLGPIPLSIMGVPNSTQTQVLILSDDTTVTIRVPDNADFTAIDTIVKAHKSTTVTSVKGDINKKFKDKVSKVKSMADVQTVLNDIVDALFDQ